MQQEDDLRALAKIMDFLRAVSIIGGRSSLLVLLRSNKAMGSEHRRGGPDSDELPPHGGTVRQYALHKTLCAGTDGAFLSGHEGR